MKKGVTIFLCAFLLVIVVICIKVNTLDDTISDNESEEETVSNNESIEIIYLDLPEQIIQDSFSEEINRQYQTMKVFLKKINRPFQTMKVLRKKCILKWHINIWQGNWFWRIGKMHILIF